MGAGRGLLPGVTTAPNTEILAMHRLRLPSTITALVAFFAAASFASTAAASTTTTWTMCATEGQTCSFTGTKEVRYGINGTYVYRTVTGGTACTNTAFGGDPVPWVVKRCELAQTITTTTDETPSGTVVGTIKFWNAEKRYGFIAPHGTGPDVFLQASAIIGSPVLAAGDTVSYQIVTGRSGPEAINVQKL
jgi:cold shock CspA family protein